MKRRDKSPILEALRLAALDEARAVEFLEAHRWGDQPLCPRCGSVEVYKMVARDGSRNKDYRWRCRGCREMFSVRTGTVFEETRLPLRVWVYAFWRACASKKGISALQLSREAEITHKSALFILRRIRHGMGHHEGDRKLQGVVEVDETYVGGKPRYKGTTKKGRGTSKAAVVAIVERGGEVRFRVPRRITADELAEALLENVDTRSRLMTDELSVYRDLASHFTGGHEYVTHKHGEYVRRGTDVHSNTVEGVFSLLKRGVTGTFHAISKKHLPNYLNEFEYRYNTRDMDDDERIVEAIRRAQGKRLEYRESVDNPPWPIATST